MLKLPKRRDATVVLDNDLVSFYVGHDFLRDFLGFYRVFHSHRGLFIAEDAVNEVFAYLTVAPHAGAFHF